MGASFEDIELELLAREDTRRVLADADFAWSDVDHQACAALRFRRGFPSCPVLVGLMGGASSGKSTLFNTLIGQEASRISAHAHETLGPLAAVHRDHVGQVQQWIGDGLLFSGLQPAVPDPQPGCGSPDAVTLVKHTLTSLNGTAVVDTPDVTSKMSADEGWLTRRLLPWFEAVVIVVDEERWYDAAVFQEYAGRARELGQRVFVVFNRTAGGAELTPQDLRRLADHAATRRAGAYTVSPFEPGTGYRPLNERTRDEVLKWLAAPCSGDRTAGLWQFVQRRTAAVVQENVERSAQYHELCRRVEDEIKALGAETHLTTDLLTHGERRLLGVGHRFLPLYELFRSIRRQVSRLGGAQRLQDEVDFEKRSDRLAEVLRRNLEHRVDHARSRVERIVCSSPYLCDRRAGWQAQWNAPPFDEHAWARRIHAHIESWKEETLKQARRSDLAAVVLGVPLLLADLLFLGGAGMTLGWTATSLAGFFGAKGLVKISQRSEAFKEYRTTVRAYQALVRESLDEQWQENLQRLPRRHLKMNDRILQALMSWSAPISPPAATGT